MAVSFHWIATLFCKSQLETRQQDQPTSQLLFRFLIRPLRRIYPKQYLINKMSLKSYLPFLLLPGIFRVRFSILVK